MALEQAYHIASFKFLWQYSIVNGRIFGKLCQNSNDEELFSCIKCAISYNNLEDSNEKASGFMIYLSFALLGCNVANFVLFVN